MLLIGFSLVDCVSAQVPFLPGDDQIGRPNDQSNLSYCIDKRDPAWTVDSQIAAAIASALLLNPEQHLIEDPATRQDLDLLYRHLREECRLYFGFKLLPEVYPDWLNVSRAYYEVGYVFVTKNSDWKRLADIPRDQPLGPTLGTAADFRLITFLKEQSEDQRWPRFPMPSDADGVRGVLEGKVAAALVWAPSFYDLRQADAAVAGLHVIASDPLPEERLPVGAVMLRGDDFLHNQVDEAIAALLSDGTIADLLQTSGLPARLPDE